MKATAEALRKKKYVPKGVKQKVSEGIVLTEVIETGVLDNLGFNKKQIKAINRAIKMTSIKTETLVREEQKQVFERFRINVRSECKKEITMMELDMEKIRMFSELAERQRIKKGVEGLRPRIWNSVHDSGYEKAINDVLKILDKEAKG